MLLSIRQNGTKKDMVVFLSAATQQSCSPREHSPRPWKCPQELERVLGSSQPITGSWIPQIQNITPGGSITQVPLEFWIHIHQPVRDPAFPSTHNILLFHVLSCGNSFSVNKQTSLFLWLPTLPLWGYNKSFISFLINAHFFMIIYAPCPWICNPWTLFHIPLEMYSETQNEESNRNGVMLAGDSPGRWHQSCFSFYPSVCFHAELLIWVMTRPLGEAVLAWGGLARVKCDQWHRMWILPCLDSGPGGRDCSLPGDLVTRLHMPWAGPIHLELTYMLHHGVGSAFFSFPNLHVNTP